MARLTLKVAYTSILLVAHAIMSLIAILNKPPVSGSRGSAHQTLEPEKQTQLLLTMEIYSSSVGHCNESLQKISRPCPR